MSLASAALLRASRLQEERNEGKKLVPLLCSWAAACPPFHVLRRFAAACYSSATEADQVRLGPCQALGEKKKIFIYNWLVRWKTGFYI